MGSESSERQDEFEGKPFKEKNELFDSQKSSNPRGAVESLTISDWSVVGSNPVKDVFLCCFFFSFFFVLFLDVRLESSFFTHHIPADNTRREQLSSELFVE